MQGNRTNRLVCQNPLQFRKLLADFEAESLLQEEKNQVGELEIDKLGLLLRHNILVPADVNPEEAFDTAVNLAKTHFRPQDMNYILGKKILFREELVHNDLFYRWPLSGSDVSQSRRRSDVSQSRRSRGSCRSSPRSHRRSWRVVKGS